jgi:hypothetical protein
MSAIDLQKIPCRTPGYVVERIDDELLLYHSERTTVVYLNQTALLVWQLCDNRSSAADITAVLSDAFPGDADRIAQDVAQVMERLVNLGIISLG